MNKPYRLGYNEGLELARKHRAKQLPYLSSGGLRLLMSERYGRRNTDSINSIKAGFCAGYDVGVQEAAVVSERRSGRNGAHTTQGG